MYSELDEVAQNIFDALSESTIDYLRFNAPRIRLLVIEQMGEETQSIIDGVTESLTALIANEKAA